MNCALFFRFLGAIILYTLLFSEQSMLLDGYCPSEQLGEAELAAILPVPAEPESDPRLREVVRVLNLVDSILGELVHFPWLAPRRMPLGVLDAVRGDIASLLKRI